MFARRFGIAQVWLLSAGLVAVASAQLSYVQSSNGLTDNPALEGGRTELEFADINGDGCVDILSIGDHGSPYVNTQEHGIMVWFGDGRGGWSVYQNGEFGYGGIAVGDVNNDGFLDVGYGMHHNYSGVDFGDQLIEVALGDGTGRNWTPWDDSLATHGETWGMFCTDFADFNSDGWLDLVSNSFGGAAGVHVYLNYHDGWWDQSFGFTGGMSRDDVASGDMDNDGNADFVVGQQYGTAYFGDGTGGFMLKDRNLPPFRGQQGRPGVALGDVDNDGAKELSFVDSSGGIDVWKWNQAADSWDDLHGGLPDAGFQTTQLCDMNCDGFMDVVGFGSGSAKVWTGDGRGQWTEAAVISTPGPGDYKAFRCGGDVDHNGYPDIALVAGEASRNAARCFKEASLVDSLRVTPVFPRGGEKFWSGSVQFIDWVCAVPPDETALVRLEYSTTGPNGPWELIADSVANSGRMQWRPVEASSLYRIRYIARTAQEVDTAITPRAFTVDRQVAVTGPRPARSRDGMPLTVRPNPVQGRAAIDYELRAAGRVRVSLSNVAGRAEQVLLDAVEPPGPRRLVADLSALPAGVYFCRVQTEGTDVRRAVCVVR